jgi:hypothetical protein
MKTNFHFQPGHQAERGHTPKLHVTKRPAGLAPQWSGGWTHGRAPSMQARPRPWRGRWRVSGGLPMRRSTPRATRAYDASARQHFTRRLTSKRDDDGGGRNSPASAVAQRWRPAVRSWGCSSWFYTTCGLLGSYLNIEKGRCHTRFLRPKPYAHRIYAQDQVVIHTVRM